MSRLVPIGILFLLLVVAYIVFGTSSSKPAATLTTTTTAPSSRGIYSVPPTITVTPFVPTGFKFLANADAVSNDVSAVTGVTLTQAAAQIPNGAVGFTFLVTDSSFISATSIGTAYYKSTIDFIPVSTRTIYRRIAGKQTYERTAGFDVGINDLGGGTGTAANAIARCQSNSACDGFTIDGTNYNLKVNISPLSYYNWSSFTYVKTSYTLPTHTWTPV